jgi:hypothetical protein
MSKAMGVLRLHKMDKPIEAEVAMAQKKEESKKSK